MVKVNLKLEVISKQSNQSVLSKFEIDRQLQLEGASLNRNTFKIVVLWQSMVNFNSQMSVLQNTKPSDVPPC